MSEKKVIGVIGTGGVGGYYGSQLQKAGHEVHYLFRSDFEHVCQYGLKVDSPNGNYSFDKVNAYKNVQDMPKCDVILLALKTTSNHLLEKLLPPALKEDGFVFALQNGIGIEDRVAEVVGENRVVGGLCFICSIKKGHGHIEHQDYGYITAGDYRADGEPAGITPRLKEIEEMFADTNVVIELKEDLVQARWSKLIFNIPFNGLSVILDADTQELTTDEYARQLAWSLMLEVGTASKVAVGREITEDFMKDIMEKTTVMRPYLPSMKLDFDAKRPLEVEAIFGEVVRRTLANGGNVDRIRTLYKQLKFLDNRLQSKV